MGILALAADERVADVEFTEDMLTVQLMDGRSLPRLGGKVRFEFVDAAGSGDFRLRQ